jgi:DNA-binding GntR family transcriptional regulator
LNKDSHIEIKLDKEKLSERFAVTARSINRILQHLRKENIIEVNANMMIIVKDLGKLVLEEERSRLM